MLSLMHDYNGILIKSIAIAMAWHGIAKRHRFECSHLKNGLWLHAIQAFGTLTPLFFFCFVGTLEVHTWEKHSKSKGNNNNISIEYSISAIDLNETRKKRKQKQIKINGTRYAIFAIYLIQWARITTKQTKNNPIACCDRINSIFSLSKSFHLIRRLFDTPNCIYTCIHSIQFT